jgi:hypothetical protein
MKHKKIWEVQGDLLDITFAAPMTHHCTSAANMGMHVKAITVHKFVTFLIIHTY